MAMRLRLWAEAVVLLSTLSGTWQATIISSTGGASLFVRLPNTPVEREPGSCEIDGVIYPSGSALPMDHPCHYCICFEAQLTCYWKQCAAPPLGCEIMHFENVCNPSLYVCKIPEKAVAPPVREFGARINSLRRRRVRSIPEYGEPLPIPEPFPVELNKEFVERLERSLGSRFRRAINGSHHHHHHHHDPHDKSCTILGVKYNLGEVIGVATDVCMECRCAAGKMFCSPKCCFLPSPFRLTPAFPASHQPAGVREDNEIQPHPLDYIRNQYDPSPFF